ncbi:response regulator transcription factor [Nocardiopsis sp. CC223A]|uniref:response regulator n=1 Tax=Nocardiopsis sp. CC223A TaxID=3044051 RepID=UPI00278C2F09|nr:response regulator transcription factor [Nocardiopsis sp. CC223A]
MISVLIADDQAMVRAGFSALLAAQRDILVLGEAGDGRAALAMARELHPDVVLLDVRMPVMDGLEAARELLSSDGYRPRVVILTTFDADEYVYAALRAGASGFLLKDSPPEDLVTAVRVVAEGDALLAPAVTRRLIEAFAARSPGRPPAEAARLAALTARETDVLRAVAAGSDNREAAAALGIAEETVKSHLGRVFAKLGLRDRAQAVVFAYESGLVTAGGR